MTLPAIAITLGGISLVAGIVVVQPIAICIGLVVLFVAFREE